MWWTKKKSALKVDHGQISFNPDDAVAAKSSEEGYLKWRARIPSPTNWVSTPARAARNVFAKSVPVHLLLQKDEDGNIDVYSSVRLGAKFLKRLFVVLPAGSFTFSDIVLVVLQGSFAVVLHVTPSSISESLRLDRFPEFCSAYIVPFLHTVQECISENRTELLSFCEEVLPALKVAGSQSVTVVKLLSHKSMPFLRHCYSEVKPRIQYHLQDVQVKEMALAVLCAVKRLLLFCSRNVNMNVVLKFSKFIADNRVEIINSLLKCLRAIIRTFIIAAPVALRLSCQLGSFSCYAFQDVVNLVSTFLEKNSELRDELTDAVTKLCSLFGESTYCSIDLVTFICSTLCNCLVLAFKLFQMSWPIVSTLVDSHSTLLLRILDFTIEVFIPLMFQLTHKLLSSETKNLIANNLPLMLCIASTVFSFLMPLCVVALCNSKYLFEKTPVVLKCLAKTSSCAYHVMNDLAVGFLLALCEIAPDLVVACRQNLPILKSGIMIVLSDVLAGAKVVTPAVYSGVRSVTRDLKNGYLEVYPDLLTAVVVVYPKFLGAYYIALPVLFEASTEVLSSLYQASCIVMPAAFHSAGIVAPTVMKAAIVSSPVVLCVSFAVYSTTKLALKELVRTSQVAMTEVISTSASGLSVLMEDLARSYHAVSRNSDIGLQKSFSTGMVVTSSAFQEVGSLLRILCCLRSTDIETLSQSHFQFELNFWDGKQVTSTLCRRSSDFLSLSLKAALFCKVFLKKGNSFATSSMCEAHIRISQCYEKMEPVVVDLAVKSGTYLKGVLRMDEKLAEGDVDNSVYRWYRAHDVFGKVSIQFPNPEYSLQTLTKETCSAIASLMTKSCSVLWRGCVHFLPHLWRFITAVSPKVWGQICNVAPDAWSAVCKLSREMWNCVRTVSPDIWYRYTLACSFSWKVLCETTPEVWKVFKRLSPLLWTSFCNLSSNAWTALCDNTEESWELLCKHGPRVWKNLCECTAFTWRSYCHLVSTSWRVFCLGVATSWKVHRTVMSTWWQSFLINKCAAGLVLRESTPFFRAGLRFGGEAWFYFCAFSAFCAILYQCDSVSELFLSSNFNGLDLSTSAISSSESKTRDKKRLPIANLALQCVVEDIVVVKSFFDNAKNLFHRFTNTASFKAATTLHAKISFNCMTASKNVFSNRYFVKYRSFFAESSYVAGYF